MMALNKITRPSVGADLSRPPPIHRPKCASPRIILSSFVILSAAKDLTQQVEMPHCAQYDNAFPERMPTTSIHRSSEASMNDP
jgi:hypothetical protein